MDNHTSGARGGKATLKKYGIAHFERLSEIAKHKTSPARRKEIATLAALARWSKVKK